MKHSVKLMLGLFIFVTSMLSAHAHPAGHHHAPCEHMRDDKMMQRHLEEHHKEGASKAGDLKEDVKTAPPAAAVKPQPKTTPKPAP